MWRKKINIFLENYKGKKKVGLKFSSLISKIYLRKIFLKTLPKFIDDVKLRQEILCPLIFFSLTRQTRNIKLHLSLIVLTEKNYFLTCHIAIFFIKLINLNNLKP